ncbi:unnamed protein product [Mytilus coruscus]|uniref:Uncharacterized protein n=1 Tax=Mytilus coruscus TaxID=42192 RepID=A0A6J8A0I3_MYTCO|nr:unnamed protein product [Mytilus coruscus]
MGVFYNVIADFIKKYGYRMVDIPDRFNGNELPKRFLDLYEALPHSGRGVSCEEIHPNHSCDLHFNVHQAPSRAGPWDNNIRVPNQRYAYKLSIAMIMSHMFTSILFVLMWHTSNGAWKIAKDHFRPIGHHQQRKTRRPSTLPVVPDTEDKLVEASVEVTPSAQNVPVETESQPGSSLLQDGEVTPINVTRTKRRVPNDATCDSVSTGTLGTNIIDFSHDPDTDDKNLAKLFFSRQFQTSEKVQEDTRNCRILSRERKRKTAVKLLREKCLPVISRSKAIYELWRDLKDVVWPARSWPYNIRQLFWKKNLKDWKRILLAAFAYVNGLNPEMLLDWAKLMGICRDNSGIRHFTAFFRLDAYNVSNNRYI